VSLRYRPGVVLVGVLQQLPFPYGNGGDTLVHITVVNGEQNKLRVGGAVDIFAEAQRRENVLWLPPQALREAGGQFYAFVRNGETERNVLVQVGVRTADRVEIVAGLVENEIVVRK
jgi:hypothetical protein